MNETLLPCPFCGGEAKKESQHGSFEGYNITNIYCQTCGARCDTTEDWNHRINTSSMLDEDTLVETLHEQLDWLTVKHIDVDSMIETILIMFNNSTQPLKKALAEAMFNRNIVTEKCIEYDPAGSTYEYDWTDKMKEWAELACVDLSKKDPASYSNRR